MFTVETKEFKSALENAKKFMQKRPDLPILQNIMVDYNNGFCRIVSTDLENTFEKWISYEGDCFAFTFGDIPNFLKASKYFGSYISFELDGDKVKCSSDNKSIVLSTIKVDEFPPTKTFKTPAVKFNVEEIIIQYKKIKHALSTDDARPVLEGVCFRNGTMNATNGFKLSALPISQQIDEPFILTPRTLDNLNLFLGSETTIQFDKDYDDYMSCQISNLTTRLTSFMISGNFPDFDIIMPKGESKESYCMDRISYIKGLEFLNSFNDRYEGNNATRYNKGLLSKKLDEQVYSIQLENNGEIEFAYNSVLMYDVLNNQFNNGKVCFKIYGNDRPIFIGDENPENGYCLLMPLHLN
jgi:DNA polymerase III sliding clamp (beta) subunit (PCNA family)